MRPDGTPVSYLYTCDHCHLRVVTAVLPVRHECGGVLVQSSDATPLGPCPVTDRDCRHLDVARVSYYCRRDLAEIEGPCGDTKRGKAERWEVPGSAVG